MPVRIVKPFEIVRLVEEEKLIGLIQLLKVMFTCPLQEGKGRVKSETLFLHSGTVERNKRLHIKETGEAGTAAKVVSCPW